MTFFGALILSLPAQAAGTAASPISIDVGSVAPGGGPGYTFTVDPAPATTNTITITENGYYTLSSLTTTTVNHVVVQTGLTDVNMTLNNVSIDVSAHDYTAAFDLTGATVNLTLTGANTLKSGHYAAGLQAPSGSTLTITAASTGSLTASGGDNGAGIGGGWNQAGGNITINGGTVIANIGSGISSAGIGGGFQGAGGNITITDGIVTANGGYGASGIGGGFGANGGNIVISGGKVTANGGKNGAGIGGGYRGPGGSITITGNADVTATGGDCPAGGCNADYGGGAGIGSGGTNAVTPRAAGTITINTTIPVHANGGTGNGAGGNGANIGEGGYNGGNGAVTTPGTSVTTYGVTVTVAPTAGGTFTAVNGSASAIPAGANQTFTFAANAGYRLVSVTVDGTNYGAVASWTIPNITDGTHTIVVKFDLKSSADAIPALNPVMLVLSGLLTLLLGGIVIGTTERGRRQH